MPATRQPRCHASVIINTYQQAATIDLALTALRLQDFTGDWEIIVADDGSCDYTADIVTRHLDTGDVRLLFRQQADRGNRWAAVRNLGIRQSTGKVLIFLDGDMIASRDLVRRHVDEQARQPGLLAGNRLWRNPRTDLDAAASPGQKLDALAASPASLDPVQRRREISEIRWRKSLLASPHPWRAWFGCHVSVPASSDVLFDETMNGWGPVDIELACRLHHRNRMPVRYLPDIRAWHLEHDAAVCNPFRASGSRAATQYVLQVCYMITKHPDLALQEVMTKGFDRLIQARDGSWATVAKGEGGDSRQVLAAALAWYAALSPDSTAAPA